MAEDRYQEQKKTLEDAKRLLKKYHKCAVIRPTGFGKTFLLTELMRGYPKVLYLYPSAVIKDTVVERYWGLDDEDGTGSADLDPETYAAYKAVGQVPGCTLMTYAKLIRLAPQEFGRMDYDLVICDEMHRMGGQMTKAACERLFAALMGKSGFIGATATPTRSDNFDVVSHFFADRMCYAYTLHDSMQAGITRKPYYCYATYDIKRDLEDMAKESGQDLRDRLVSDTISAKAIELGQLFNMPYIIRDACGSYASDTSYMKFIVFFASHAHMQEKLPDVKGWFREAYPSHALHTLPISSRNAEESSNISRLKGMSRTPMRIDLIACVDMLNMGYHVGDLTGILMYRGTKSGTIFAQQLGRALSAGAESPAIVFDIVDNLHRKAVYELYVKPAPGIRRKKKAGAAKDCYVYDQTSSRILFQSPDGSLIQTQYHVTEKGTIVDATGHASTFMLRDGQVVNKADPMSEAKDINRITPECLVATGHEATYRELLAKAMAEPLSHRCKYALQLHFRSWCMSHGVPYPISDEDLSELYSLDIQDFYKEFRKAIAEKKINYPLQDAEGLLSVGADGSTDAPLAICCEATGVSVEALLDMLFQ